MDTHDKQKYKKLCNASAGDFQAFLYDCDGTLVDNMHAHAKTYIQVAEDFGVRIDGRIIEELAGWPVIDVVKEINRRYQTDMDPNEFARLRNRRYLDRYINDANPIKFVVNHLIESAGKVKIGVVSGGQRESVEKTLTLLGIGHHVQVTVCAGETRQGKPFPDPFLAAAEQLGVLPEKCLVFEDGDPGVASAVAAGMHWIRIDKI